MLVRDVIATAGTSYRISFVDTLRGTADSVRSEVEFLTTFLVPEASRPVAALSILATDTGVGRMNIRFEKALGPDGPPAFLGPNPSTTLTPAGHITRPHIDPFPGEGLVYHLEGRKIWVVFPPSDHNLNEVFQSYERGESPDLVWWMDRLERPEVYLLEKAGTAFVMPAGTIHACISLDQSSHTGACLVTMDSLDFCASYLDKLKKLIRPGCGGELEAAGNDFALTVLFDDYLEVWKKLSQDPRVPETDRCRVQEWAQDFCRWTVQSENVLTLPAEVVDIARKGLRDTPGSSVSKPAATARRKRRRH
ncbi:hypothetical protein V5O48_009175 [Marasmius crinis-equi]